MSEPITSPFTRAQFLDRVHGALSLRVLCWLGAGGSTNGAPIGAYKHFKG